MKIPNPIKNLKEAVYLFDEMLYTRKVKNSSRFTTSIKPKPNTIGVDFHALYDDDNITYVYIIEGLPQKLNLNFKDVLRKECKGDTKLNFYNYVRNHKIDWDSAQMTSRLRIMRNEDKKRQEEDNDEYNLHENIGGINRSSRIRKSLKYFAEADKDIGLALLKTTITMTISGKKGEEMDETVAGVEARATKLGFKLERVLYNIPEHLQYYSPFIKNDDTKWTRNLPTHILTDELLARFNTYEQGELGRRGMCFGMDIESGYPALKVVKPKDDSAEIWLVAAETGGGKSNLVKDYILQLQGINFKGTIMDIEGNEYTYLGDFIEKDSKVVRINMAEGSGNYFDAVEIPKLTGIEEIDSNAMNLAINFTSTTFMALLGEEGERDSYYSTIITDALSDVYREAGVSEDRTTWGNSVGKTYFDVFDKIVSYQESKKSKPREFHLVLDKTIDLLARYFEKGGARASVFKQRIQISDIVDADLVICSFGMAGKSENSVDKIQMELMQLSAAQISHQRSIFAFSQGYFNFKVWEELQRWGNFKGSKETLGVAITGGRKLGDVNIVITNAVSKMLNDDTFSILQNYTSVMIGAIADEQVRAELCKRLSIPEMTEEVHRIAKAPKPTGEENDEDNRIDSSVLSESKYSYAFLIGLDRANYGVVKVINTPEVRVSPIFKTGVDKNRRKLKRTPMKGRV